MELTTHPLSYFVIREMGLALFMHHRQGQGPGQGLHFGP